MAGTPVRLTFDEALKFRAHAKPQIRAAVRAVDIFVRTVGHLNDYYTRSSFDAFSKRIFDERSAERYGDRYLIVNVKRRVRVGRREKYLDEERAGLGGLPLRPRLQLSHSVHFIQDAAAPASL